MIISLSGLIGSGKDTVAEILVEQHGFVRDSFASTLKDAVSIIFGWDRTMLEGKTADARAKREEIDQWWATRLNMPHLSPRWVLQFFGTEVMRGHFDDNIWIAALERRLVNLNQTGKDIVISDARFINELAMLTRLGAKTIRVFRGESPEWWADAVLVHKDENAKNRMLSTNIHSSEWDWAGYKFDSDLSNNGTLDELAIATKHLRY